MASTPTLDQLWQSVTPGQQLFLPERLSGLPETAQRYLNYAIAPGTQLATAVRLQMQGQIRLKNWLPFTAEQVIVWKRGLIWQATVWMKGLPILGSDRLVDGVGQMQWKLLGLIPIKTASGQDIDRSTLGRMQGEMIWLPSVFCHPETTWVEADETHATARLTLLNQKTDLHFTINPEGQLEQFQFERWGNPGGADFRSASFGGICTAAQTFDGYTIPTQLRAGWYFGSDRFESEGEFFRAKITKAVYR